MFSGKKCQQQWHAMVTIVLALATLGNGTQIEMILSVSNRPRWPRQIHFMLVACCITDIFGYKLHQCTQAYIEFVGKTLSSFVPRKYSPYLPLPILGDSAQIGLVLFCVRCPRCPRQVQKWLSCVTVAAIFSLIFTKFFANVNMALFVSHHPRWPRQVVTAVVGQTAHQNACGFAANFASVNEP